MDAWQTTGMAQRLRGHQLNVNDITFSAQLNDHVARTMRPLLRHSRAPRVVIWEGCVQPRMEQEDSMAPKRTSRAHDR
jgi:hypothetical protein